MKAKEVNFRGSLYLSVSLRHIRMMLPLEPFAIVTLALLLDAVIGDPKRIYARVPHPVVLIGWAIGGMDKVLNRADRKPQSKFFLGILSIIGLSSGLGIIGVSLSDALAEFQRGWAVEAFLIALFLAGKSLSDHVSAVRDGLNNGLVEGQRAVSKIVGRDPNSLDETGVARAGIESLAENFSDGVVAPVFWALVFGLPGLLIYKAVNTADSMIGHKTDKHRDFGWAAARLDDLLNLFPARLSGLLIIAAGVLCKGAAVGGGLRAIARDARHHRSPNAGYPEAAMAGVLGLRLAGPRRYGNEVVDDAWMGKGRAEATPADITRALRLYWTALAILVLICGAISVRLL